MTTKRGIVDPWKVVAPLTTPPPPKAPAKGEKVDLQNVDMDADIRVSQHCVFRGKHASIEVANKNIRTEIDGLCDLVRCLFDVLDLDDGAALFDAQSIGLRLGTRTHASPGTDTQTATLSADIATIYFLNQTLDQGLFRLVRILRAVQRRTEGETILKRWGVTPMLR